MRVVPPDQIRHSQLNFSDSHAHVSFFSTPLIFRVDVMVILSFSCPSCSRHVSSPALPPCLPIPFDCIHHMYTGLVYSDHLRYVAETATCTMPAQYALKLNQCFMPLPPPVRTVHRGVSIQSQPLHAQALHARWWRARSDSQERLRPCQPLCLWWPRRLPALSPPSLPCSPSLPPLPSLWYGSVLSPLAHMHPCGPSPASPVSGPSAAPPVTSPTFVLVCLVSVCPPLNPRSEVAPLAPPRHSSSLLLLPSSAIALAVGCGPVVLSCGCIGGAQCCPPAVGWVVV